MLKKGDKVKVWNMAAGGLVVMEGIATIVKKRNKKDLYVVGFEGDEGATYPRFCQEKDKV